MKSIVLLVILFEGFSVFSQKTPILSPEALKADFKIFKESITTVHGGLYWYNDSLSIASGFNDIENKLNEPMALEDFYALLQEFYASLGCGHSWMSMPKTWRNTLDENLKFPFYLYFEKNKITIINDLTPEKNLNEGWEVDSINGEPALIGFQSLWKYAPSDGYNQTKRVNTIAWNFDSYYQTFKGVNDSVQLFISDPKTGESKNIKVATISKNLRDSLHKERNQRVEEEVEGLSIKMKEDYAILRIAGFTPWQTKLKSSGYKKFLKKSFKSISASGTSKLIVDLRGNGGGKDRWGAWLCRYLIPKDFKYFDKMEARTNRFNFKENSPNKGLNLVGKLFKKDKRNEGIYLWTHHNPLKTQKSNKYAFDKNLILLIDGSTFSTAADVASVVSSNINATFIGEETGGGYYGNTSAISYRMQLKNSNIWYYIPVVRYYTSTSENRPKGHGVTPDIEIENSYENWINFEDAVLQKAIDLD